MPKFFSKRSAGALSLVFSLSSASTSARQIQFAPDFKWCVATAAYQIEGDNVNSDLYRWESERPDRVLTRIAVPGAPQGPIPNPQFGEVQAPCPVVAAAVAQTIDPLGLHTRKFPRPDGQVSVCEFSGRSVDHWNRVAEDVKLIHNLGVNQYRFSVEWSRVEPREGEFDELALAHYADEVRQLHVAGIEPLVTLFHFSLPQWFRDQGGWENPRAAKLFARFTAKVYAALGDRVRMWFTLNEPMIHLVAGYSAGVLPPGQISMSLAALEKPMIGILSAHAAAYRTLHRLAKQAHRPVRVGLAHHLRVFDPVDRSLGMLAPDSLFVNMVDRLWNWVVVDAVETGELAASLGAMKWTIRRIPGLAHSEDFFGLNYYTRDRLHFNPFAATPVSNEVDPRAVAAGQVNDMGWELYPRGFYRTLKAIDRHLLRVSGRRLPIFVSENGIADDLDTKRQGYLEDHLAAMFDAMHGYAYGSEEPSGEAPVQVEGYCHWSLLDNFEWNSGFFPHFGFYAVDLQTQRRQLRPSGEWFARMIKANGFSRP